MGPLRGVLLAVVLLDFAVGAEDGGCKGGGLAAFCEVTEVEGVVAILKCGEGSVNHGDRGISNVTIIGTDQMSVVTDKTLNYSDTNNYSVPDDIIPFSEKTNITISSEFEQLDKDDLNNTFNTNKSMISKKYKNENISIYDDTNVKNAVEISNSSYKKSDRIYQSFTALRIILNSTVSLLDLTSFPNVKNVTINTSNYSLLRTCGTKNVTDLSITFSQLGEIPIFQYLLGVKYLNLSYNNITEIKLKELPSSVKSLDLSFNKLCINKNISLPSSLQFLNVSYNNITNFENFILKGNLSALNVRGNRLKFVPEIEMTSLEELDLSENNISDLQPYVFEKLTSLTVLDLRKNTLTSIRERAFQGLNKLQLLDISENDIIMLSPATFQYLNNLVTLILSGNINLGSLQHVKDASLLFGTSQRLQIIEASKTNLTRIPPTLTRSVRKLFLAGNSISIIQCGDLDSFPLLQTIDISRNTIYEIEEDALGRLDFLTQLILAENKLKSIPKSLPDQLEIFDLRCNLVDKLNRFDLLGMQKLRVLLLSRNKITIIDDGAFGQLSSLEVLDLSHNPIKLLSRTSFIGPRRLKEIYLVSLKDLIPLQEPLSFPAPESAHLEVLNVESSPVLATQLMDDVAALTMFHELFELNLNHCRLSTLRSDLPKYLPRLHKLELTGNELNCTNIIWLVKWLQALNISMQDTGKFRQEIYNLKDICCQKSDVAESYDRAKVICASPEYLSGKEIISLEEENFPDLKLTSSTLPSVRQSFIIEHYPQESFADSVYNTSPSAPDMIDSSSTPTLSIHNSTDVTSEESVTSDVTTLQTHVKQTNLQIRPNSLQNRSLINENVLDKPLVKSSKLVKSVKSINQESQKWKYLKNENQHSPSLDSVVVLFNEINNTNRDFDNHLNESASLGAYLSHEFPPTSHPGMVVFLLMVSGLIIAVSAMLYSQCSQSYRSRNYQHQQDIEVSSFGGNDLW